MQVNFIKRYNVCVNYINLTSTTNVNAVQKTLAGDAKNGQTA